MVEPAVRAFFGDDFPDVVEDFLLNDWGIVLVIDDRERDAPGTLTGNAPVSAVFDHVDHLLFAPSWLPFDLVDSIKELFSDWLDRAEPLRGGSEYDRFMGPPIVRIAMDDINLFEEMSVLGQKVDDDCIAVGVEKAVDWVILFHMDDTFLIDRASWADAIFKAGIEVIGTEVWGDMDATRAVFGGDV